MEKTIHIYIASTAFLCSQDAYDMLSSYLERLRKHFESEDGRDEIMRDIESRIAEKLLERKQQLITITDVSAVIGDIGEVSELDDDVAESHERVERRLYRDTDTAMIAGVASGIAAYFNTSTLFIRLLFVISIFFGGTGIILYVFLWVLVPEAKTAAQKLEMRGSPVTFESIGRIIKTRSENGRPVGALARISSSLRATVATLLRAASLGTGALLALGAFFGVIACTVLLGIVLTNWNASYNDIPFRDVSSPLLLKSALFAGYVSALIPLLFIFALGARLMRMRNLLPSAVGFGLVGAWSLALIITGVTGVKIAGDYYEHTQTNPEYAVTTETRELPVFQRILVDGVRVQIRSGNGIGAAEIEGRARDIENVSLAVVDGVLTVRANEFEESCLFCNRSMPTVTIFPGSASSIEVENGRVMFDEYVGTELAIDVTYGSVYGTITADRLTLVADDATVRAEVSAHELSLDGSGSSMDLDGTVEEAALTLSDTSLRADALVIQNATVEANDSHAQLDVRGTFEQTVDNESTILLEDRTAFEETEE